MTIVVEKAIIEVTIQRDDDPGFPFDEPIDSLAKVWNAMFKLIESGAKDARIRVGNVDVVWRSTGVEEAHEAGDN